jgi:predicted NBD/HSP70 family sugar kinase
VPGLVDRDRGLVVAAPNLGWHDLDLAGAVTEALGPRGLRYSGSEVRIDNDANYAALAESTYGVARGAAQVLYLTGTIGLGAGLVVEGRVQRGANGFAGEVGHLPVGGSARTCACGRTGCWETTVGLRAIARAAGTQEVADGDPLAVAQQVSHRAATDPAVRDALAEVATALGTGLVTLAGVLDPAVIVLGGSFVPLGPLLVPEVERALATGLLGGGSRRCVVALSTLGLGAASTGAAADVLSDVFDGRSPLS